MFAADQPAVVAPAETPGQADVIEVVGTRSDQALKIDRRTYRVQQNPHTAQKDSIQLLRGLPAVTVTPDDTIMLLGARNVSIYIDGRPYQGDATQYLRTLHGTDIERIEVITNPSAQYSPLGTGGIINFVLRKKQEDGVSGNASSEVTSLGRGNFDSRLKSRHGKWTYELGAGGRIGTQSRSHYRKLRSVEAAPGEEPTVNTEEGGGPTRGTEGQADAKITYELDPKTSISGSVLAAAARDFSIDHAEFIGLTPDFESFSERQRFTTTLKYLISEVTFDHKGSKDGETLGGSLRLVSNPQRELNAAEFSDGGALSVGKNKHFLVATGQVDWQHPMGKGQILSVGGTWNRTRMEERYRFMSAGSDGVLGTDAADQFTGVDDNLAAYVTFQQPVGGWTLMPGVRVERDSRRIASRGHADVRIERTDLFPTLHIDRSLGKTVKLTLSYSKRIDRPQLNDLRPYAIVQDVLTKKLGNPHLRDQSTDSYEVNLHYHRKTVDAGVILYDRVTNGLWSSDYTVVDGVNVVTLVNAGRSRDRGAEIDISTPLINRVKLNASVNLFDQRVPIRLADGPASDERFRYTTNATLEWDGPDRGKTPGDIAQLQWIFYSPSRLYQISYPASHWFSLSYTHSFSHTVSLTGTAEYLTANRHRLIAPLVQESFVQRSPAQFKLKLLKTFGAP